MKHNCGACMYVFCTLIIMVIYNMHALYRVYCIMLVSGLVSKPIFLRSNIDKGPPDGSEGLSEKNCTFLQGSEAQ